MLLTHLTLYQGTPAEDTHLCEGEAHSYIFTKLPLNVSTAPFGRKKKSTSYNKGCVQRQQVTCFKKNKFIFNTSQEQDADRFEKFSKQTIHTLLSTLDSKQHIGTDLIPGLRWFSKM